MDSSKRGQDLIEWRRAQILAAAKKIFAAKGYSLTKTDDIAAAINVGKGTLYRYFFDKRGLFLAVYNEGLKELDHQMEADVYAISDVVEHIKAGVRTFFTFFDSDNDLIEIMMQVRSDFKEDYRESYMSVRGVYSARLESVLEKGVESGIFRQMDLGRTSKAIGDMLSGTLQDFYYSQSQERLMDSYDAVCKLLLNGIIRKA